MLKISSAVAITMALVAPAAGFMTGTPALRATGLKMQASGYAPGAAAQTNSAYVTPEAEMAKYRQWAAAAAGPASVTSAPGASSAAPAVAAPAAASYQTPEDEMAKYRQWASTVPAPGQKAAPSYGAAPAASAPAAGQANYETPEAEMDKYRQWASTVTLDRASAPASGGSAAPAASAPTSNSVPQGEDAASVLARMRAMG